MLKKLLCAVALLCVYASAQTVNPNQIRPGAANGEVLTTVTANQPPSWQQVQSVLIQTNGTPNVSQSLLNFSNTTPAAPAGYTNVLWQNSGGNESAYVPTGAPGSGTLGFIPLWTPSGTTLGNSHLDDGVTTAGTVTSSEPFAAAVTSSGGGGKASITGSNGGTSSTAIVSGDYLCPNMATGMDSGCTLNVGRSAAQSDDNDAVLEYKYNGNTPGQNRGGLAMGSSSGDHVALEWDWNQNVYLPTLLNAASLATDANGKIIAGSGGGGTTTHPLTAATTGGAAPGTTFNGSAAVTFDYHSFGAPGISGTPATGNCVDWASTNTLGDTGSPCGSGGGSGVSSLNALTGALSITGDSTITVTPSGSSIALHATGGGGGGTLAPYGSIYSANTWADLSAFTINGATASVIAAGTGSCPAGTNSCIQVSGGAGNFTQTVDYRFDTQSPIWTVDATGIAGTGFGFGFGLRSNESQGHFQGLDLRTDMTTGTVYLDNQGSSVDTASITVGAGDVLKYHLTRVYDLLSGFVYDETSHTIGNVSYQYPVTTVPPEMPNIGRFAIYSLGGTQTITSFSISAGLPKGADIACGGDSKTSPYFPTTFAGGWCAALQGYGYRSYPVAGGFDVTADIVAELPEIEALAPKYYILMIGGNDVRDGISSATYEANIANIVSTLTGAGITVYVTTYPVENSGVDMTTLNSWITGAGCSCNFIDINNSFPQAGSGVPSAWLASDTIHPAQPFHTYIAQTIAARLQKDGVGMQFPYYAAP